MGWGGGTQAFEVMVKPTVQEGVGTFRVPPGHKLVESGGGKISNLSGSSLCFSVL